MRYAIISDVHANYEALSVVLDDIKEKNIDEIVCLGDTVGYGAEPVKCLEIIIDKGVKTVVGNHDWAAIERVSIDFFNAYAKQASIWTREHLNEGHKKWLSDLPLITTTDDFAIAHGTFHQPESFHYIQTVFDAQLSFEALEETGKKVGFLGHSHVPVTFFNTTPITYTLDLETPIDKNGTIVNVGSVGQPRDENPMSSYAIYDVEEEKVNIIRLEYDVEAASAKIKESGLPEVLAQRLFLGK